MLEVEEKSKKISIKVLSQLQKTNFYDIEEFDTGYIKVRFNLNNAQTTDDGNIVFEGDIYKIANFCAIAAVNEENIFVVSSCIEFLTRVEISSNEIIFEANSTSSSLGKRFVEVKAKINDIDVFWGDFTLLKLDNRSKIKM